MLRLCLLMVAAIVAGCRSQPPYEGKSIAQLEAMLADADVKVQAQGAYGLSLKGAEALPAAPALCQALQSPDVLVRQYAARALGEIGPAAAPEAVIPLIEALHAKDWVIQRQAALALGQLGPAAGQALPELERLASSPHRPVRDAAAEARQKLLKR